jgi:hypothetical protein
MRRLVKSLELGNGELYASISGNRVKLAKCKPKIEVYEDVTYIPLLGTKGYNVKTMHLSIVLCSDMEYSIRVVPELFKRIIGFDLKGDILRMDGIVECLQLYNLIPEEINIDGVWRFELPQDKEMIEKLLNI